MLSSAPINRDSPMQHRSSYQASDTEFGGNAQDIGPRRLRERQREFAAAILNPDLPVPLGLIGPDGSPSVKRFAVYRNNVVAGLVETLKAAFPAVERLVGGDFFAAMARIYIRQEPPRSPIMLDYGATFADFIGTFEPAKAVPYLRDVARLERAWVEAYHSAEAPLIKPDQLGGLGPDLFPTIRLFLHPSVRVLQSSFPVVTIWQMNVEGCAPSPVDIERSAEDALVVRPVAEVEVRRLPAGAAIFIQEVAAGTSAADATTLALRNGRSFDLAAMLRGLFEIGVIVGWNLSDDADLVATAGAV